MEITTLEELQEVVSENSRVFVDFWAEWCGPCKTVAPVLEEIEEEIEDLVLVKVDVDQSQELAAQFRIRSIPTVLYYKDGHNTAILLGARTKEVYLKALEDY